MNLEKGLDRNTAKIFSCMIHSDRPREVNELPTISARNFCKIKEALLIRDLKPALNENIGSEKLLLY